MQQQVNDTERDEIFQRLKASPENNKCFDCDKKNPKWSSVYLGLYLCLDCAGKHREYGPQISFARSLNLDTWNRRYITFMELGGNAKAAEYFKKQGLKTPYDYKNATIQKYKQELTKKVDAALGTGKAQEEAPKQVFASKPFEDEKSQTPGLSSGSAKLTAKSQSDKPTHGDKPSEDPFANNVVINKNQVKPKGFTVEFNKSKTGSTQGKGRLAAKKIDNVDLDALTLQEDGPVNKNKFGMAESGFGLINNKNTVKEVFSQSNSPYLNEQSNDDKLKKFQNAKAISSESFRTDNQGFDASNARKFAGASAISSSQFFGEKEEEDDNEGEIDYQQAADNIKEFYSALGTKLKEKAEGFMAKVKDEWDQ